MSQTGSGGLGTVSGGIAEALVTTAFGLLVAIPAVFAFNYLQSWVDARGVDLSESSNELLDSVARGYGLALDTRQFLPEEDGEEQKVATTSGFMPRQGAPSVAKTNVR